MEVPDHMECVAADSVLPCSGGIQSGQKVNQGNHLQKSNRFKTYQHLETYNVSIIIFRQLNIILSTFNLCLTLKLCK